MANIVLTSKCNLSCSYCFSKEYMNGENQIFDISNFKKVVDFIKTEPNERIGLVGGEPFLHPKIDEILKILYSDDEIQNVIIFTNGTYINKYIDLLNDKKFYLLINCNYSQSNKSNFSYLKKNLNLLKESKMKNFSLGINLYSSFNDFTFIFDLLHSVDKHELRFSLSFSKEEKLSANNIINFYKKYKVFYMKFLEECNKRQIVAICDCNPIPDCLFDEYEKNIIMKQNLLANKLDIDYRYGSFKPCPPLIDIFPDLTAVRSLCYSTENKVSISKFPSISVLRQYFFNTIDIYNELILIDKNCFACIKRLAGKCRICPIFKGKKGLKLKERILKQKI